jgi:Flp pilus assembly protein TadD
VYAALAYVTYLQKRAAGAISYLEKALAIDPTNANALNSLGYILADQEINLDTALRYCVEAVKHNPKSPAYLDSLGWAYFKQGDVARARAAIDRARKMAPGNGEIAGHWDALQRDAG